LTNSLQNDKINYFTL